MQQWRENTDRGKNKKTKTLQVSEEKKVMRTKKKISLYLTPRGQTRGRKDENHHTSDTQIQAFRFVCVAPDKTCWLSSPVITPISPGITPHTHAAWVYVSLCEEHTHTHTDSTGGLLMFADCLFVFTDADTKVQHFLSLVSLTPHLCYTFTFFLIAVKLLS